MIAGTVFGDVLWYVGFLLIPLSIGFSILRYRLYDIDVLINLTLVYGSLTVLLAMLYFGLIFALPTNCATRLLKRLIPNSKNESYAE